MVRMPLTELCLQIKSLSLGEIKTFLSQVILIRNHTWPFSYLECVLGINLKAHSVFLQAIEPPHEDVICSALDVLYKVLPWLPYCFYIIDKCNLITNWIVVHGSVVTSNEIISFPFTQNCWHSFVFISCVCLGWGVEWKWGANTSWISFGKVTCGCIDWKGAHSCKCVVMRSLMYHVYPIFHCQILRLIYSFSFPFIA